MKVRINRSSRHYQLMQYAHTTDDPPWAPPQQLCAYFWQLLLAPSECFSVAVDAVLMRWIGTEVSTATRRELAGLVAYSWSIGVIALLLSRLPWSGYLAGGDHAWAVFGMVWILLMPAFATFVLTLWGVFWLALTVVSACISAVCWCWCRIFPARSRRFAVPSRAWRRLRALGTAACPRVEYEGGETT